jgi:hypothetical protein
MEKGTKKAKEILRWEKKEKEEGGEEEAGERGKEEEAALSVKWTSFYVL